MAEITKRKILDAACRMISERGLEGMRTKDVANAAEVSTALLHYHYGSRRALILAAFEYSDDHAVDFVSGSGDSPSSGREQLRNLLLAWASEDGAMQRHWIIWGEIWRWSMFEPELRQAVAERHARFVESIVDRIRLGKADGSIGKHIHTDQAAQRLAACSDSFGDQAVIGIKSLGEVRMALVEAIEHECELEETKL